jgi:hypothetical protein
MFINKDTKWKEKAIDGKERDKMTAGLFIPKTNGTFGG